MLIMPKVNNVTITPAIKRPMKINPQARSFGILKINAQSEAVQAPVRGKGTATNVIKAIFL
jgi:hypothetical protein